MDIDYLKLVNAIEYYKSNGFKYVHLDWLVDEEISNITKPDLSENFFIKNKTLVGSGEQSFLQMIKNKNLEKGRYVGITPCFRDETSIDYLHSQYFMKVELIDTLNVSFKSLYEIIDISKNFFIQYIKCETLEISSHFIDIIDSKNHIELGSYGIRSYNDINWIYATGCAEPRLTRAISML